jgi:myo-inositol catabolism protein IolC
MLIYKGFKQALEKLIPTDYGAILCDEEFGSEVLLDAKHNGFITILTIEKSGEQEFKFQYEDFAQHIERFRPTCTKVLIKYNPTDAENLKERQKKNLKIVSDYSHDNNYKFLLEVLVLPTEEELKKVNGDREEYDSKLRPGLTVEVIKDLQKAGIEPDVWKLEGFNKQEDYKKILEAARAGGRDNVSLVVLGRGAGEEKVDEWLRIGSRVPGVIGFAVGRTVFWEALEKFYKGQIGKAEVIQRVSDNFQNFYRIFTENKPTS